MNKSHFFSLATIVTTVDDRKTKFYKIRNKMIRRIKIIIIANEPGELRREPGEAAAS